jgi:anti-sigma factor RsiW
MEAHLAGCEACRSEASELAQWKRLTRGTGKRFSTSPQFRKRLEEQYVPDRARSLWLPRSVAALAASGALGGGMLFAVDYRGALARRQVFGEVADQHAAILATGSALEVTSRQDKEVESWFQEKIPFAWSVPAWPF